MDAAQILKKTALFFSAALVFAAPSFAQLVLNGSGNTASVTLYSNQPASVQVSSSGGSPISFNVSSPNIGPGFTVQGLPSNGTTPTTLTFSAYSVSCATGTGSCNGTITLTEVNNTQDTATISVTYSNSTSSGGGSFTATPTQVNVLPNSTGTVTLKNNSSSQISYTIGPASPSTLFATIPTSGTIGTIPGSGSATVTVFPLGPAGTGSFTVTSGSTVLTISVTVGTGTTTSGGLVASPNPFTLYYPPTATQSNFGSVTVSNANGNNSTSFYATVAPQSGGQWLTLLSGTSANPVSMIAGQGQLALYVNSGVAAGLAAGSYTATVYLNDATSGNTLGSFVVDLLVGGATSPSTGVASPTSLGFTYQAGASGQASPQTIVVSGTGVQVIATSSGNFPANPGINAFPTSPTTVEVQVLSGIATAGTYSGSVTVSSSAGSQTIPVTLTVSPSTAPVFLVYPGDFTCTYTAGQTNTCSGILGIIPSDGSTSDAYSITSSAAWVTPSPASGTGRSNIYVTIDPTQLANGFNNATLTVTPTGSSNSITTSVTVPVAVLVSGSSNNTGTLTLTPSTLNLNTTTTSGTVNVTAANGGNTVFGISSSATWLSATASNNNTTPSTLTVTINPSGLQGSTSGSIYLTVNGATAATLTVNVSVSAGGNIIVTAGNTTLGSSTGLTFTSQAGGAAPGPQSISIASASGSASVQFNWSTSASWLLVNQTQTGTGATPTSLPVTVNPAGLTPSATPYSGTVTITPVGGTAITFPVSYTVTPSASISVSPTSLSFSYNAGGSTPAAQSLTVSSSDSSIALNFTAVANSTGNWLQVSPASGTTGTPLQVSLTNLSSLSVNQTYTGTITITGQTSGGVAAGTATVNVSLTVSAPLPTITKITNAASGNTGAIAAGEIITIFGTSLGPDPGAVMTPSGGLYPTTNPANNVQVLVGGYPAPLIYVSSGQINAIVPYEINRPVYLQNVNVYVKYLGQTSNAISLAQVSAAPGLFTANASGSGPGAILNSDLTLNSAGNPAPAGSTVVLYLTGEGQTQPAGVSGKVTSGTAPFTLPVLTPTVTINGQPAQVSFYAEAPTLVSGVLQINVQIPPGTPSGAQPVVVSLGGNASQMNANGIGAVTVAVK